MVAESHDVIRSGAELVNSASGRWLTRGEIDRPTVILLHGFTSHGRYLQQLADYIREHGYVCALFNYDSYLGIDTAAVALQERLRPLASTLSAHRGFALVAHSMGGLVARQFERTTGGVLREPLRGLALLGTPNRGALGGGQYVSYMLDW